MYARVVPPDAATSSHLTIDIAGSGQSTQLTLKVASSISVPMTLAVPYQGAFTHTVVGLSTGILELVSGPPDMSLTGYVLDWPYLPSDENKMYEVVLHAYHSEGFAYDYTTNGAVMHWGVPVHLRTACKGLTYSYRPTIAAELPTSLPVTYAVESSTPDLTIAPDGTISYTGTVADSFEISLTAAGLTYRSLFSLTMNPACSPISLILPPEVCGELNSISRTSLLVVDSDFSGTGAHIWTITGLTASMVVDYSSTWPEIWWVPELGDSGTTVYVEVRNVGGVTQYATISFIVNLPPLLQAIPDMSLDPLCELHYQIHYSDPENDPLTTSISPSSISLSGDLLAASSPPVADTYTVSIAVSDLHRTITLLQVNLFKWTSQDSVHLSTYCTYQSVSKEKFVILN